MGLAVAAPGDTGIGLLRDFGPNTRAAVVMKIELVQDFGRRACARAPLGMRVSALSPPLVAPARSCPAERKHAPVA